MNASFPTAFLAVPVTLTHGNELKISPQAFTC